MSFESGIARFQRWNRNGNLHAFLLASSASAALLIGLSGPAFAISFGDGGRGGNGAGSYGGASGGSGYEGAYGASADSSGGGGGGSAGGGLGGLGFAGGGYGGVGGNHGFIADGSVGTAAQYSGTDGGDGTDGLASGGGGGGAGGFGGIIPFGIHSYPGGIFAGGNGGNGGDGGVANESGAGSDGGNGGSGGVGMLSTETSNLVINDGLIAGGKGGNGGSGSNGVSDDEDPYPGGGGGYGGDGGAGLIALGAQTTVTNTGTITGGDGGNGGRGAFDSAGQLAAPSGYGGNGGAGVMILASGGTLTNSGTITGGQGGISGGAIPSAGRGGTGVAGTGLAIVNSGTISGGGGKGFGISGSDLQITNSGTISGASGGAGYAIYFDGGTNSLTLEAGSTITGKVVAYVDYLTREHNDSLALGGDEDASFDLSAIGTQYVDFGSFQKIGSSIWTLSGTTDPLLELDPMPWTIYGGTLVIGDKDHPDTDLVGDVTVESDGRLMGFGTVTGTVTNFSDGVIMPGSPTDTGKLTIDGDYLQYDASKGGSGRLAILVTPEKSSLLAVTGTATLGGTVNAVYAPGVYTAKSYTILTAQTVTGTFDTLGGETPNGFEQALSYATPGEVDLVLSGGGPTPPDGPDDPIVVTPTDDTTFNAAGSSAINGTQDANDTLLGYLGGLGGNGGNGGTASLIRPIRIALTGDEGLKGLLSPVPTFNAWFQATGRLSALDGSGVASGFRTKSGGVMTGIDKTFDGGLVAGIALGFDQTYLDESNGNSGHISTPRAALYGRYVSGDLGIDAALGYAHDFIDTRRPIAATGETATASHGGDEISAALQASYRFDVAGLTLTPRAGAQYVHLAEESFSESGATGFNLDVAHRDADSLRPFIGVSAAKSLRTEGGTKLTPRLDVEYSRETMNNAPSNTVTVGGGSFVVDGVEPSRDRVTVGAGLDAQVSNTLTLHAGYRATLPTGNLFEQTVQVGVSYSF
ncbi:autotransporter domain-containing protein [Parvibaculum sp.]|uniref:autotransporter family protein n=1 Tax=Parvibaculum sp. TaxID=2024848 RepID=UPI002B56EBFA|nr:autotransporter domain-containing protein [Parvibaculum sp.]HUD51502.1 autotransporter domain-containing protein [Parvibaculum sp.]